MPDKIEYSGSNTWRVVHSATTGCARTGCARCPRRAQFVCVAMQVATRLDHRPLRHTLRDRPWLSYGTQTDPTLGFRPDVARVRNMHGPRSGMLLEQRSVFDVAELPKVLWCKWRRCSSRAEPFQSGLGFRVPGGISAKVRVSRSGPRPPLRRQIRAFSAHFRENSRLSVLVPGHGRPQQWPLSTSYTDSRRS